MGVSALFVLTACANHPVGQRSLLTFLQDRVTTKDEVRAGIGTPLTWSGGRLWTYRIGEDSDGFYLSPQKSDWSVARCSLVREFDRDGISTATHSSM
jgi:hypothetical protein